MNQEHPWDQNTQKSYEVSGKIMLSAIVIILFIVILMVILHIYGRWYLHRSNTHRRRTRGNSPGQIFIYVDPNNPVSTGLDPSVLCALPVFAYNKTHPGVIECSVCLSELEEGEKGRVLPKCDHRFHLDCIDMWFQSHSTCPICRTRVEPGNTAVPEPASSSSGFKSAGSLPMSLKRILSIGSKTTSGVDENGSNSSNVAMSQQVDVELGQGQKRENDVGF